jgi:hypothetical protein
VDAVLIEHPALTGEQVADCHEPREGEKQSEHHAKQLAAARAHAVHGSI